MKVCSSCKSKKEFTDFPRHRQTSDGLYSWCKECCRKKSAETRSKWTPEQLQQNRERANNRAKTSAGRASQKRAREKAKESGKQKILQAAAMAVVYAVYNAKLARPVYCTSNGRYGNNCLGACLPSPHHYKGYDRENWLEIEWLCRSCHAVANKRGKQNESV